MNTPSPLVPQGTIPSRGKSTVFFKVLMILAVHVVLIGGMLLQGCKDTKDNSAIQPVPDTNTTAAATNTDTLPPTTTTAGISNAVTGGPTAQNPAPVAQPQPLSTSAPVAQPQPLPPPVMAPPVATAPTTDAREYVIASGDTLGALAKKNGLSLKTLLEANPGVNPKKLKVGQKIQIPAGAGAAATSATAAGGAADTGMATGDTATYTVKSGDTLARIAKLNHTSYKKIMALNDLKTTSIKVGQKLKLPAPKSAVTESAAPATTVAPVQPAAPATPPTVGVPGTTASNQ